MFRGEKQNRAMRVHCSKHPSKYGQRTYDIYDDRRVYSHRGCVECTRKFKIINI